MSSESLLEVVDRLLLSARPGGTPHKRLLKYRDQLERNVMLGPASLRYIRELAIQLEDRIECRHLTTLGRCRKNRVACPHRDDNTKCRGYEKARPALKGNPLGRTR